VLDIVFLWKELTFHFFQYRYKAFIGMTGVLLVLFFLNYTPPMVRAFSLQLILPHQHHGSTLEIIVMGGILGCSISHLLKKKP
jgi:hypothetical protein